MSSAGLVLAAVALLVAIASLILVLGVRAAQKRARVPRQPVAASLGPSREEVSQMIQVPTGDLVKAARNHESRLSRLEQAAQSLNARLEELRAEIAETPQPGGQVGPGPKPTFHPRLTPTEVAARTAAVGDECRRVDSLDAALTASEAVVGGTSTARQELMDVLNDGQRCLNTLDSTMDFLREAQANPDAAALRESEVVARYEALGDDPARGLRIRVDAVVRDRVLGVLSALWSRAQDDRELGQLLEQLRDAACVELIEPRPGEQFDAYLHDLVEYVPGGNAEKISRTMKPGIVFRDESVSKPGVRVFRGV